MGTRSSGAVVHQPRTSLAFQRGTRRVTALLRPTLGPLPRTVAIDTLRTRAPELLDDGGVIVRRLIQLGDRDEDVGAMFLRGLLWRVHTTAGDGVATTSVLFQAIFDGGLTAVAADINPMGLRQHLHDGLRLILAELDAQTMPVDCQDRLARIAAAACPDPALAQHLAELIWVLGGHGQVEVRAGRTRELRSEVIEGSYWGTPLVSTTALPGSETRRIELDRPVIVISNLELAEPEVLLRSLTLAREAGAGSLVIIARKIADQCLAYLAVNDRPDFRAIAVRTPGLGPPDRHVAALHDLAVLTDGRAFLAEAGDSLTALQPELLGRARRAWADRQHFGVVSPAADPRRLRDHVRDLRRFHQESDDPETRTELSERLARLSASSAVLWVDGATSQEIDRRKDLTRRTVAALRGALQAGALPGGGAALLACRSRLRERLGATTTPEERAAYQILLRALSEPTRAILSNSGHDQGRILADLERAGPAYGLDANTGQVVEIEAAGILDSAAVVKLAVRTAVEGAAQALTIDTLVHHRQPAEAMTP